MRVVVIGASGFVGHAIYHHLKDHHQTVSASRHGNDIILDITQPSTLKSAFEPDDIVINAAGYANATDKTPAGIEMFRAVNVDGVRHLAEACVHSGVAQLIHLSSVAAMGRVQGEDICEADYVPVASPYATSKLEGERVLAEFFDALPITIVRPTSVFGEGRGLAATLCKVVARGVVPLPGGGEAKLPFSYVGNLTEAVSRTVRNDACYGETFIVGDEQSYRLRDVVTALADALDVTPRVIPVPVGVARVGVRGLELLSSLLRRPPVLDRGRLQTLTTSVSYNIDKFQAATGYVPPYSLGDAAERLARWYRQEQHRQNQQR